MGDKTGIEWTDATWNPVTGCDKVSPGCAHCYAEDVAVRFWAAQYPPVEHTYYDVDICGYATDLRPRVFTDVQCHEDRLEQPLRWKRPRRVFVNSMSDLFHEVVPDSFIDRIFAVMALTPQHTYQVLTKRPDRMLRYCRSDDSTNLDYEPDLDGEATRDAFIEGAAQAIYARRNPGDDPSMWLAVHQPLPNVWLGVSVENQHFADERIPLLLKTPAAVRFVSAEPLLGPIDLSSPVLQADSDSYLDWVITGGESGPKSRPCDVAWIRSIVQQCQVAGVPVFVKQLGANRVMRAADLVDHAPTGKADDPAAWPEDLKIREYPQCGA